MTARSLLGVLWLDATLIAVGSSVLWALGARRTWRPILRLVGVAWLVGAACLVGALSLELIVGVPFGVPSVAVTAVLIAVPGLLRRQRGGGAEGTRWPGWRPLVATAAGAGATAVVLEAQFRAGRLSPLAEWDAMAFWVPKAESIYFSGSLAPSFLVQVSNPGYPPLVPTLDALAFVFMGAVDAVTLHLVYWSALAALVASVAGLLGPRVSPFLLWPPLLVVLAAPELVERGVAPLADQLLDYLVALALLCIAIWVLEDEGWCLPAASILLGAAALTKREGALFAAALIVAALLATWSTRRRHWSPLLVAAAPLVVATLVWRAWLAQHHVPAPDTEIGYLGVFTHAGRIWPSVHLALHVLYGWQWWAAAPFVVGAALVVAFAAGGGIAARLLAWYALLALLVCVWGVISFPSFPYSTNDSLNAIVRELGAALIPAGAVLPLVLRFALDPRDAGLPAIRLRRDGAVATCIALAALLVYPAVLLATGLPRFPSARGCVTKATRDGEIELLLGRFATAERGRELAARARKVGFVDTRADVDACGLVSVVVPGYSDLAGARSAVEEARSAGFSATPIVAP